ncbi:hypothetical protein RQP53_09360 [Paucibacter sp. APW11]|uniref:ABC transporter permease n=1 Tax=Roseateles aquae TaxID=3077235 RepID=A0ABU3PBH0_9BURK|nr:hypothetical protein [Paucibacter sp. APW11]MDT8999473.1 hypothetical protein [Paucibacter sp. APW11]
MTSQRFKTLLHREWMQHHAGWLMVMLAVPLIALLALPWGKVELAPDDHMPPPTILALLALTGVVMATWALSWMVTMFQLPGLARRDQQDRSIEFWLSLPGSHSESIAATLLMHALFVPLLAVLVGAAAGLLLCAGALIKVYGFASLAQVSWGMVLGAGFAGLLRLLLGVTLMTLWFAPLFMILMVASAWLKRWGTPLVIAATVIGGNVLTRVYDNRIVWELLQAQAQGAGKAFFDASDTLRHGLKEPADLGSFITEASRWMLEDSVTAISQLASPHLIGGLLISAACFYLLVLYRRRAN